MKKILIILVLFVSVGFSDNKKKLSKDANEISLNNKTDEDYYLDLYRRAFDLIIKNYADSANSVELIKNSIDGMMYDLDPYTRLLEGSAKDKMDILRKGKYGGVGFSIGVRKKILTVLSVMEESPAYSEGINAGDHILMIDSTLTKGLTVKDAVSLIKGEVGSSVELSIYRPSVKKKINFDLTRNNIIIKHVPYWGVDENGIGYIRITKFSKNVASDFKKGLEEMKDNKNLKGIVIDLRNNSGGLLSGAIKIVDYFTERGEIILKSRGKKTNSNRVWKSRSKPVIGSDIPLTVLINKNSASASEIVAGSLQDLDRAVILGQKSFGKGLIQHPYDLNDTLTLKITTSKYYLPSGRLIQTEDYFKKGFLEKGFEADSIFVSKTGRKLKGGGGITPDILLEKNVIPKYVKAIWKSGAFTSFAAEYYVKNPELKKDLNINRTIIRNFKKYLDKYELNYIIEGEAEFIKLKDKLTETDVINNKKYISFQEKEMLNRIERYFENSHNMQFILNSNERWIENGLLREFSRIIFGSKEEIKVSLYEDLEYKKATEIILQKKSYKNILNL